MMRSSQTLLLVSLMLLYESVLVTGKSRIAKRNTTDIIVPKTFKGRRGNCTGENCTFILIDLENDTIDYSTGILSTRVIPVAYIVAIVIGIPANAVILGTLSAKTKTFSTAILYFSLAVSDLLFLFTLTFKVHYHLNGNDWVFGEAACRVVTACFYGNTYCSIHTLMCISLKRYVAIVHPFTYKRLPKRQCTIWVSLTVWAVFLVAMVPELLVRQSYSLPQVGITTCHDVLPLEEGPHSLLLYYKLALTFIGLVPPFAVTVFTYVSILRQLNRSDHDWIHYIKMSTLVFVIFTMCFAPSSVIHFAHYVKLYTSGRDRFYAYYNAAVCLCGLHSCLDPFLFTIMSKTTGSKLRFLRFRGKNISISA